MGHEVAGAEILLANLHTKSARNGTCSFNIPAGVYNLVISAGSGRIFYTKITLSVSGNNPVIILSALTTLKQILPLAYIPGNYDNIEEVIIDSLGYNATLITLSALDNLTNLSNFGALFLNCGLLTSSSANMDSLKYANLLNYTTGYGSIYASDFAVECLTGDGFWRLPNQANSGSHEHGNIKGSAAATTCFNPIPGGFIADSALCTSKSGSAGHFTNVTILDTNLVNVLGKDSTEITFDLPQWEVIHSFDVPFQAVMTHAIWGPLVVRADLAPAETHGTIYFTTFHNEVQGVSDDVETILDYIILNL